jgi:hypothetical protein
LVVKLQSEGGPYHPEEERQSYPPLGGGSPINPCGEKGTIPAPGDEVALSTAVATREPYQPRGRRQPYQPLWREGNPISPKEEEKALHHLWGGGNLTNPWRRNKQPYLPLWGRGNPTSPKRKGSPIYPWGEVAALSTPVGRREPYQRQGEEAALSTVVGTKEPYQPRGRGSPINPCGKERTLPVPG